MRPCLIDHDDAAFAAAVERGVEPEGGFRHRDHLRLAWIYLRAGTPDAAAARAATTIRAFAAHQQAEGKYHDTITRCWIRLVAAAMRLTPGLPDLGSLLAAHPHLLDKNVLTRFYSEDVLRSDAARAGWIEPDRAPLP